MKLFLFGIALLCFGLSVAQEEPRLRLRRPRPFKDIDNVDGIAKGRPVPLKAGRVDPSHLLASAFEGQESQQRSQQANAALESLLATAGRASPSRSNVSPQEVIFEEVAFDQRIQVPQQQRSRPIQDSEEVQRPARPRGRTRIAPKIPRRKPSENNEVPKKFKPRKPSVKTTERYSYENDDGSFTFGYVSEDGSFREETRGVDCITRGKYGYIDPEGKKREFTYVSGLPCDTPEDDLQSDDEKSLQRVVEDPVDPAERFRTSNPVQVSENDFPPSFVRNRQRVRLPQSGASPIRQSKPKAQDFPSFNRERVRPTSPAPTRRPVPSSGALNNLFAIVDDKPTEAPIPKRPATPVTRIPASPSPSRAPPSPTPSRIPSSTPSGRPSSIPSNRPSPTPSRRPSPTPSRRPSPTPSRQPSPTPSRQPTPISFDFQTTLSDFDNRRPAITFDSPEGKNKQANPAGPNFSSELSFNPERGTFQTELRQSFGGQEELQLSQPNASSGHNQPPQSFASTTTASPFASFSTAAPKPTRPRPTSFASSNESPSINFEPLDFPDPNTVKLPEPAVASPEQSVFFEPFPSSTAALPQVPSTTRAPITSFPATPTATPVRTLPPSPNRAKPPPQIRPALPQRQNRPPVPPPPQPFGSNQPVQFGFNPISTGSQQTRAKPFTAFASGTPPQLTDPSFRQRPQSFGGVPQQQHQSFGRVPQQPPQSFGQFRSFPAQPQGPPQQQGARFLSTGRPTPPPQQNSAASAPFAVFNPAAFAGVRGA